MDYYEIYYKKKCIEVNGLLIAKTTNSLIVTGFGLFFH